MGDGRQWQSKRAENCLLGENLLRYIVYWWSEEESLNVSTRNQENMFKSTEVTESRTIESLTRHVKSCRSNSIVLGLKTGIIRVLQRKYSKAGDNLMSEQFFLIKIFSNIIEQQLKLIRTLLPSIMFDG